MGSLANSQRQQPDSAVYNQDVTVAQARAITLKSLLRRAHQLLEQAFQRCFQIVVNAGMHG